VLRLGRPFSVIQPVRLAPAEAHKRQLKQCFYPVTCHNIDYSRDGVMMLRQLTDVFSRRISPRMRHIEGRSLHPIGTSRAKMGLPNTPKPSNFECLWPRPFGQNS
jgi:hypothetical protein